MKKINYLTSNSFKFKIASKYFDGIDSYDLVQCSLDIAEIQDASCEEVAANAAVACAKIIGEPCMKLDVGFSIESLGGFPGPFVKYINEWLSEEKILSMIESESDRTAYFIDALAVGYPDGSSKVFSKKYKGRLANYDEYKKSSWPTNSLFIPEGYDCPLGMMTDAEQVAYWGHGSWPEMIKYLENN